MPPLLIERRPAMVFLKPRKLELQVLEVLWTEGALSMREVRDRLPGPDRPTYEAVRPIIARLLSRKDVRRARRVGKTLIFEAAASRDAMRNTVIDDFADLFAGEMQAVFTRLLQTGRCTADDLRAVERMAGRKAG